jgi:hypothetical protein
MNRFGALLHPATLRICAAVFLVSQFGSGGALADETDAATLWQLITFNTAMEHRKSLKKSLQDHIAETGDDGPCRSWIMEIETGRNAGQLALQRGPLKYSDLKAPCLSPANEDWKSGVLKHVESLNNEYFRQHNELSHPGSADAPRTQVQYIRFFEVRTGLESEAADLMLQISNRIKAVEHANAWVFFSSVFEAGNTGSSHLAIASYHPDMDDLARNHGLSQLMGEDFDESVGRVFASTRGFVMR